MDWEQYERVDVWFEEHKEQLLCDIMRLVRIPSIADPADEVKPYGQGCLNALEEMLRIGREHGFHTENYENQVGSIGNKEKNFENTIGFWNHLDVVPVGKGWEYEPFEPVMKEHFLIGRGAQDNKGPAIGILYMLQCIRELQIPMKHELCLFVGCDEERGMEDLEYYRKHYKTPKLSMIADSGFPVCYGEKGIIEGQMVSDRKLSDKILELTGGNASNMIPDYAAAVLKRTPELEKELSEINQKWTIGYRMQAGNNKMLTESDEKLPDGKDNLDISIEGDGIRVAATGTSKHSAFPEGSRNAIHELSYFLAGLHSLELEDCAMFTALSQVSGEYYGENVGITYKDEISGRTTCTATILKLEDRKLSVHFNIRYAITANAKDILTQLEEYAGSINAHWQLVRHSAPNYFPKEHPAVKLLTDTYNEITGEQKEAFVMGGGTYARKLPNAFAYGIGGMQETEEDIKAKEKLFGKGHGGAHEPDEGLNTRLLLEAMKIYTMSIIAMNDCPL